MATKFSDDLSVNVRRGIREHLEQGQWHNYPKLGYLRDHGTMQVIPDPERFDLVRDIWRLRLGGVSIQELLLKCRTTWKLTTPKRKKNGGSLLSHSQLYRLLKDPFYAGIMVSQGVSYPGKHQPMITWSEFERVQVGFQHGYHVKTKAALDFTYRGLLSCGACTAAVTAEQKLNRYGYQYVYYHCCRKNRRYGYCSEPSLEQEQLESQFHSFLQSLYLPQDLLELMLEELPRLHATRQQGQNGDEQRLKELIARNQARLRQMRELCADGHITPQEYDEDRERYFVQEQHIKEQLTTTENNARLIESLKERLILAHHAVSRFEKGGAVTRRELIKSVSSNLLIKNKTLLIKAQEPFETYRNINIIDSLRRGRPHVRTFLAQSLKMIRSYKSDSWLSS